MSNKSSKSDYKKDIVKLVGIDFDLIPINNLRSVLLQSAAFLPYLLNKDNKLTQSQVETYLKGELVEKNKEKERKEIAWKNHQRMLTCEAFKQNYWKRRMAATACLTRFPLGSYVSKRIMLPIYSESSKADIIKSLKKYFPFNLLDESTMNLIPEAMSKLTFDAGEFLVKKDLMIEKCFYVATGLFGTVIHHDSCYVTSYLRPGDCFGASYVLFGTFSPTTIKCLHPATIWVIDATNFHSVCHWELQAADDFLVETLSKTPGLEGSEAIRLLNALIKVRLDAGVDLLSCTPRSALYTIFNGKVLVTEVNPRGDEFTRTCEKGDIFGYDRLFTKRFTRLQNAVTLTESTLYYINEDAFHRLFDVEELYKKSDIEVKSDPLFYRTL